MGTKFEVVQKKHPAVIRIAGVGSGGVNAVNTMIATKVAGVEYAAINTDVQSLSLSTADVVVELNGPTRGNGAGGDPMKGREAAIQERHRIEDYVKGADMLILATGLGGGTGTGATPVVGEVAKSLGVLTVAVVTLPFTWEGEEKMRLALEGLDKVRESVDAYVVIPNDKMMKVAPKGLSMRKSLALIDHVLCESVNGIVDLITRPGYINRDFEDVRAVLANCGLCVMGTGVGEGEGRAKIAVEQALNNPLLEDTPVEGAKKILVNIVQSDDGTPEETALVMEKVKECLADGGKISFGLAFDEKLGDRIKVSIIASGLDDIEVVDTRAAIEVPAVSTRGMPVDTRGMPNFAVRPALSEQEAFDRTRGRAAPATPPNPYTLNQVFGADESELDPTPAYLRVGADGRVPVLGGQPGGGYGKA